MSFNPSHFEVLFDREIIRNWETAFENCFLKAPTCKNRPFRIQEYVQIRYKIDGTLNSTPHYSWNLSSPFRFWTGNFSQESLQEIDFIKKLFEESGTSFHGISVPESDEDPVAPVKPKKRGNPRKTTDSKKGGPPRKGTDIKRRGRPSLDCLKKTIKGT
jgi:hypothetical protein